MRIKPVHEIKQQILTLKLDEINEQSLIQNVIQIPMFLSYMDKIWIK